MQVYIGIEWELGLSLRDVRLPVYISRFYKPKIEIDDHAIYIKGGEKFFSLIDETCDNLEIITFPVPLEKLSTEIKAAERKVEACSCQIAKDIKKDIGVFLPYSNMDHLGSEKFRTKHINVSYSNKFLERQIRIHLTDNCLPICFGVGKDLLYNLRLHLQVPYNFNSYKIIYDFFRNHKIGDMIKREKLKSLYETIWDERYQSNEAWFVGYTYGKGKGFVKLKGLI